MALLKPTKWEMLACCSIREFNSYFGSVSSSNKNIESPSNWSIGKFKDNFPDNDDFLNVCKFKWCFNAKPDIVIHTTKDHAVCIEAKYESGVGIYPSKKSEKEIFNHRGLKYVSQTETQENIMELLGIKTEFIFLSKNHSEHRNHKCMRWNEAFNGLELESCPYFINEWIKKLNNSEPIFQHLPFRQNNQNRLLKTRQTERTNIALNNKNRITIEYDNRLEKMRHFFPIGYEFMRYPESHPTIIWLSTSLNAHLYLGNKFLAYIKIKNDELVFSPKFHIQIAESTTDQSHLLFSNNLNDLIISFGGFKDKWSILKDNKIVFTRFTPKEFFDALIYFIENIDCSETSDS